MDFGRSLGCRALKCCENEEENKGATKLSETGYLAEIRSLRMMDGESLRIQ